jgi:hypothetical protein
MYHRAACQPRAAPMPRLKNTPPESRSVPALSPAALDLMARLRRGPVPLAGLRDRDDAMRALDVASARGAARLALDAATGTAFVVTGAPGR